MSNKRRNKVYSVVTNENHETFPVTFSDNFTFACAAITVHETFSSLTRIKRSDLSKNELENAVHFDNEDDFKDYVVQNIDVEV